jgi:hypothetical protein
VRVAAPGRLAAITVTAALLFGLPAHAASKPAPPQSDAEIERNIRGRFAKSKIAANGFQVTVRNGVATLAGKTEVIQHKGVATRLAKAGGARAVNNKIEISEAARQKAAETLSKGRRRSSGQRGEARSAPRNSGAKPLVDAGPAPPANSPPPPRRAVVRWPK